MIFLCACANGPDQDVALSGTPLPSGRSIEGKTATSGVPQTLAASPAAARTAEQTAAPTAAQTVMQTAIQATVAPQAYTKRPKVCSPLDGVPLDQVPGKIVNPYHPPPPGADDPHEGIDLAQLLPGGSIAVAGLPVHLVLSGKVAGVVADRFPYGNAVLVETPLESLPAEWLAQLQLPTPGPTLTPHSALTCPAALAPVLNAEKRSLYLVYAHLGQPVQFQVGDALECGQQIGVIGSSGNALNPHLHLEARIGPGGARFSSMAHYDNTATLEEMSNYCLWRISGLFQLIDPVRILSTPEP